MASTSVSKRVCKVCIPNTHHDYFDYLASDEEPLIGARVWVPFRNKTRLGLVIGYNQTDVESDKLKTIEAIIDTKALINDEILSLCQWISTYYQYPLSEVVSLCLPKKYRQGDLALLPMTDSYELAQPIAEILEKMGAKARRQRDLINYLHEQSKAIDKKQLTAQGFTQAQFNALEESGFILKKQQVQMPFVNHGPLESKLALNHEQDIALSAMTQELDNYHCFLLQGVTGSGKTEVYLQLIEKILSANRQVLILVPEIGLTPQLLSRFKNRFKEPMVVIHSHLNDTERQIAWQLAADNLARLVIGTRTAIFTPMPSLGLIIIDEEHDASLKQLDGVRYSARDTALMRAWQANIPIVLGSATPSLESLHNCSQNKYSLLRLDKKAISSSPLHYQIVDIRCIPLAHGLAPKTMDSIAAHLHRGNQVLVFINRRGFAPVLLCHQCGWMADCSACDTHLTMHRQSAQLICHHCGKINRIPKFCPHCKNNELVPIGAGTQRIHEYLQTQFPDTVLVRIDRDEIRKKNALDQQLERINSGEAQLIVGTQMLAKGHHFPRLTLVVILDTDAGFYNQDFRALERLGQLLTQVSGRAGRAEHAGEVLIQTHLPQHPLLNLLIQKGYEDFAQELLTMRQMGEMPPYHYLALIRAQDKLPAKVLGFLHKVKQALESEGIRVMGPAPAPLARKAEQHRMQILIKSGSRKTLHGALTRLRLWLQANKLSQSIRWTIDVDPIDLS